MGHLAQAQSSFEGCLWDRRLTVTHALSDRLDLGVYIYLFSDDGGGGACCGVSQLYRLHYIYILT